MVGKRPTGGLKRLSVLSSLHWLTSPMTMGPVPGSTSKSWYRRGWMEMLMPGSRRTWVPAGTVTVRPSRWTVTSETLSMDSSGRELYTRMSRVPPQRLIMSSILLQWKWLGEYCPSFR